MQRTNLFITFILATSSAVLNQNNRDRILRGSSTIRTKKKLYDVKTMDRGVMMIDISSSKKLTINNKISKSLLHSKQNKDGKVVQPEKSLCMPHGRFGEPL